MDTSEGKKGTIQMNFPSLAQTTSPERIELLIALNLLSFGTQFFQLSLFLNQSLDSSQSARLLYSEFVN